MLSAKAAAPFLILIALAPVVRPKSAQPMSAWLYPALVGGVTLLGLIIGFGVPWSNHMTRRRIRVGERGILIISGHKPAATRVPRIMHRTISLDSVTSVRFERRPFGSGVAFDVICVRTRSTPEELIIGIAPAESVDDVRDHMRKWGYPVADETHAPNPNLSHD